MKIGNRILRISLLATLLFIMALFFVVYPSYKEKAINDYADKARIELNHFNFFMEEFVTNTKNDLIVLSDSNVFQLNNKDLTSYMTVEVDGFEFTPNEFELKIMDYFEDYTKVNTFIDFIYFGNTSGEIVASTLLYESGSGPENLSNYDPRVRPWYFDAVAMPNEAIVTQPYVGPSGYDFYITTSKAIKDEKGNIIGVVGIDLNIDNLSDYFKTVRKDQAGLLGIVQGNTMIQIENDTVLLSEVSEELSRAVTTLYDTDKKYIEYNNEASNMLVALPGNLPEWDYLLLIPNDIVLENVKASFFGIYSSVIVFLSLGILVLLYSLQKIVIQPIGVLGSSAAYIAKTGDLELKIESSSSYELTVVADSFNQMIERIKENQDNLEAEVTLRTKELQLQKELLESFINNSTTLIYFKDRDLRYLLVNQTWRDLFGIEDDVDVIGKTALEVLGSEDYTNASDDLAIIESKKPASLENELVVNGDKRQFVEMKFPLFDDYGEVTTICTISTDRTAYKKAEADLIQKTEQQKILFDTMPIGVTMISSTGKILEANRIAEEILGMSVEDQKKSEISSKEYHIIQSNGEVMPMEAYPASRVLNGEALVSNVEMGVVSEDGVIWISTTAAAVEGDSRGVVVIFEDTTKRREAEQDLINAKLSAEEALRVKSDFLANMSHEIRTPMNAIIGLGSLLEKTGLNLKQYDYVEKVNRSANNLLGIINDILDFSKIEAGKLLMENVSFSLNEIMGNISSVIGVKGFDKGIEFLIIKESDVPETLMGDPLRLNQVLLNLCNNAVKFTDKGEVSIRVSVTEKKENRVLLRFSVKDSGIGMNAEQMSNLFSAFSQADTSITRKYGGTGLGLAISKKIIDFMGGSIEVNSEKGVGSEFYFELPFEYNEASNHKSNVVPETLKSLKIAVLDDSLVAREVYEHYLSAFIEKVELFSAIDKFKSAVKSEVYDLVLLDYKLVGTTGLEVWKDIKDSIDEKTKAVLITAYGKEEVVEAANKLGIDIVLMKPVTQSTLYDGLMIALDENKVDFLETTVPDYVEKMASYAGNRILLVEDNKINQQVALENLENIGFTVEIANNGVEAIEMVVNSTEGYELILMDLQMPIMDGFTATVKIRELKTEEELPIIALSADVMKETIMRIETLGMQSHVAKPIDLKILLSEMSKVLKPKEAKHKNKAPVLTVDDEIDFETLLADLDIANALERLGGNRPLFHKLLDGFHKDYKDSFTDKIVEGDVEGAVRYFHTLKGLSGNIGATILQKLSGQLERGINDGLINIEDLENSPIAIELKDETYKVIAAIGKLGPVVSETTVLINEEELDSEKLEVLMDQLVDLLDDYDMESETVLSQLSNFIDSRLGKDRSAELGKLIESYDFEEAAEMVTEIRNELR